MRRYGSFYWPLALTSLVLLLENQFQNAVLARYENGMSELATFTLASSSFQLVNSVLLFVPQTVTVFGRRAASRILCLRFVMAMGLLLSLPLTAMAFIPTGSRLMADVMGVPDAVRVTFVNYLRWLAPLILVNALRQHYTGVLILAERTRVVTLQNLLHLIVLVGVLLAGWKGGIAAAPTVAGATVAANLLHLATTWASSRHVSLPEMDRTPVPSYREVSAFFWPVAVTSSMFAMSRPVLYAFISRTEGALVTVAALRLAFDASMFFQNPVNQFRHVYTTFGKEDPEGVRRFLLSVTAGMTAVILVLAFTPLSTLLFRDVLGAPADALAQAEQALRVLCLVPSMIALRNLHHGHMMVSRRTNGMALGACLRVLAIGLLAWMLFSAGWLNHATGALLMVVGFGAEALTSAWVTGRMRT